MILGMAVQPVVAQEVARYICYRASSLIQVDGKLDEAAWKNAPRSEPFVDIVTGEPAWFKTRVALLWDDKFLYVGFDVPEPRLWATLTERDSPIYRDNDVEVFIAGRDAYYEFEINARNTIYEVFWIWKDIFREGSIYYGTPEFNLKQQKVRTLSGVGGHTHPRGPRWGFMDWDFPGLLHAVHLEGTLNKDDDVDQGWTVELALPWKGMKWLADGRSLPPKDGDVWRIDCSRFQHFDAKGQRLKRAAGWTWNKHGHYDSHIPETFPYITFSTKVP
jgi:hypothetical protein